MKDNILFIYLFILVFLLESRMKKFPCNVSNEVQKSSGLPDFCLESHYEKVLGALPTSFKIVVFPAHGDDPRCPKSKVSHAKFKSYGISS